MPLMTASLLASLLLAAAPAAPTHRILIVAGGKTSAEANAAVRAIRADQASVAQPAPGYPVIVESSTIPGLNPGYVIAVFGACPVGDVPCLLTLEEARRELAVSTRNGGVGLAGAYFRDVVWTTSAPAPTLSNVRPLRRVVPGAKTATLQLWNLDVEGCALSFGGVAAGPAGERRVFDDGPVRKAAGGRPRSCGIHWGENDCNPRVKGDDVVITWHCEYPKRCEGGAEGEDQQAVVETLSARDGKFRRAFEKGELIPGTCEEIPGD